MSDQKTDVQIGKVISGRYEIVRLLGEGGMGAVYQARQISMDRMVALKLIHAHIKGSNSGEEAVKRFHREMKATSKIEHPNTIQVFDYGETEGGQLFLAMEFLDGRPLSKILAKDGALPLDRILHIALQIARALGAAHSEGIAHRDLKPDNVMLLDRYGEKDFVKVLDFGIARFVDGDTTRTQMTADGAVIGTPAYMSPEQAKGTGIDTRTDFYSLGVMLYQMAVGSLPFNSPTPVSLLVAHAMEIPPAPSTVAPGKVSSQLEALILRLLAKEPGERPSTAAELVALLEGCRASSEAHARTAEAARPAELAPNPKRPSTPTPPTVHAPTERTAPSPGQSGGGKGWLVGLLVGVLVLGGGGFAGYRYVWLPRHLGGGVIVDGPPKDPKDPKDPKEPKELKDPKDPPTVKKGPTDGARARLEAALVADGDPATPEACRTKDGPVLAAIATAAEQLHLSNTKAGPREQEALAALEKVPPEGDGPTTAEYFAIAARGHLVVDATPDKALELASRAAERCPTLALAHNLVGGAQLRAHNNDAAESAYIKAIGAEKGYVAPRYNLGMLALRKGDAAAAVQSFDAVVERNPKHPLVHIGRGQAHLLLKQNKEAIADLEQAALRHPEMAVVWMLLGQARTKMGLKATAKEAYCKAKELGNADAAKLCK